MFGLLVFGLLPVLLAPAATPQHPNVLVIIGDDHAPYVYGAYGNALVTSIFLGCCGITDSGRTSTDAPQVYSN